MVYLTKITPDRHHQMSFEEFLDPTSNVGYSWYNTKSSTTTYVINESREKYISAVKPKLEMWNNLLDSFVSNNKKLYDIDRKELYYTFHIPKKSGGLRRIDAPNSELMTALRDLKCTLENSFGVLHHTAAFAYVKKRNTVEAVKKHQQNQSKWFAKFDLSDFFGSHTVDYMMKMLSKIYPFSELIRYGYSDNLKKALELGFLNGGLPQGTPLSPLLTNLLMIPIDYTISKKLRETGRNFIYTRYADDFLISSSAYFNYKEIEEMIIKTLQDFEAPFSLNKKKTRYGSSKGSNWNLGVMLNDNNEITIGHKKKKQFEAMLFNYSMDRKNNKPWELNDIQVLEGYRNYYRMIEPEVIDKIVQHMSNKLGTDIVSNIKEDLRGD